MTPHERQKILARYKEHAARFAETAKARGPEDPASGSGLATAVTSSGTPTARQIEVLQLIADGLSNDEIATRLVVSIETVKTHVRHVLAKLDASGRAHAVAVGFRRQLVT